MEFLSLKRKKENKYLDALQQLLFLPISLPIL
jgi:hypothetical protein